MPNPERVAAERIAKFLNCREHLEHLERIIREAYAGEADWTQERCSKCNRLLHEVGASVGKTCADCFVGASPSDELVKVLSGLLDEMRAEVSSKSTGILHESATNYWADRIDWILTRHRASAERILKTLK